MWKSVGVDGGPGGKELHYPLLRGSYQVCACLRTGILSETHLKCSRTDSGSCKSGVTWINEYIQRLGIKPEWDLPLVCQIHLQNRYVFDHVLTAPGLSPVLDLDLFSFSFSCFYGTYSPAIVVMLLKQVCSAGGWKPLFQTRHALPLCFSAVVYARASGEEKPGLEALEGRVCSFLQYTSKDRMLLCLAWVPLGNKTLSLKYLAQPLGGMLKTHPQYCDSNKEHSKRSICCVLWWEHVMWKYIKLWKSIGLGSEQQSGINKSVKW